uniref:ATP synthase complex subunit 8 n=1 Tax=Pseudoniphargus unisexualis TaxID=2211537 RepID=A0A345UEE8_9CRUS|nr:ATP synthase F0 subunit 8 [Pseudoniphargus unisexualis]
MPQMAPSLWSLMLILLAVSLFFLMCYLYFLLNKMNQQLISTKTDTQVYDWKW